MSAEQRLRAVQQTLFILLIFLSSVKTKKEMGVNPSGLYECPRKRADGLAGGTLAQRAAVRKIH